MSHDPRAGHPEFTPTDPPRPPPKRILGVSVPRISQPPETRISETGAAAKTGSTLKRAGFSFAAVAGLIITLWTTEPAWLDDDHHAPPEPPAEQCATQEAFDELQAQHMVTRSQVQRLGEMICELNDGSPGPNWPCNRQDYHTPHQIPPLKKTDRIYPEQ